MRDAFECVTPTLVPECSAKPAFAFATPSVRTPREYPPPLNFTDGPAPARVPAKRVRRVFSPPHGVGMHAFPLRSRSTRLHHHAPPTTNTHTHARTQTVKAHRPRADSSQHARPAVRPAVRPSVRSQQSVSRVYNATQRNATQSHSERTNEGMFVDSFVPANPSERTTQHSTAQREKDSPARPARPASAPSHTNLLACLPLRDCDCDCAGFPHSHTK